jgi:hypothetical protein
MEPAKTVALARVRYLVQIQRRGEVVPHLVQAPVELGLLDPALKQHITQ